jgi:UDP-glucose 4-epimerase
MFGVFLKQKLSKMPFTVVGDGSQKRDFTYVSDVVEAFIKSIHYSGKEKFFNIGSGKPTTVNFITSLLGGKKVYIPKRPGEPSITHAEIKLAKSKLQWNPRINIIEGVNLLSKNINYWKEAPLWTPRKIKKATKIWFNQLG